MITDLQRLDSGEIGCEASNNESVVVLTARLVVTEQREEMKVVLGEAAVLPCNVRGEKGPISWYKDSELVSSQPMLEDGSLLIKAVEAEDLGQYFCEAVTVRLRLQQQIYLIISFQFLAFY